MFYDGIKNSRDAQSEGINDERTDDDSLMSSSTSSVIHRPARDASGSTKRKVSLCCSVVTRRSVPRVGGSFGKFLELGGELKAVLVLHLLN